MATEDEDLAEVLRKSEEEHQEQLRREEEHEKAALRQAIEASCLDAGVPVPQDSGALAVPAPQDSKGADDAIPESDADDPDIARAIKQSKEDALRRKEEEAEIERALLESAEAARECRGAEAQKDASAAGGAYTLKATRKASDTRRVPVSWPADTSMAEVLAILTSAVQHVFKLVSPTLKYEDDEGDLCTLTEMSVEDFLSLAKQGTLRVEVEERRVEVEDAQAPSLPVPVVTSDGVPEWDIQGHSEFAIHTPTGSRKSLDLEEVPPTRALTEAVPLVSEPEVPETLEDVPPATATAPGELQTAPPDMVLPEEVPVSEEPQILLEDVTPAAALEVPETLEDVPPATATAPGELQTVPPDMVLPDMVLPEEVPVSEEPQILLEEVPPAAALEVSEMVEEVPPATATAPQELQTVPRDMVLTEEVPLVAESEEPQTSLLEEATPGGPQTSVEGAAWESPEKNDPDEDDWEMVPVAGQEAMPPPVLAPAEPAASSLQEAMLPATATHHADGSPEALSDAEDDNAVEDCLE